jgi:hypothetical protein
MIRDALARIIEELTGARPAKEVLAPQWQVRGKDALLDLRLIHDDLWVDVTVAYPYCAAAASRDGAAALLAEAEKRKKYPGASLIPCAMEAQGRFGEAFLAFLRRLVRQLEPAERNERLRDAYQSLSAALQRGNALILASAARR